MNDEKRFHDIVMRMFSGEDELIKDDRTIKKMIRNNTLAIQFLRKFDPDFLEFFFENFVKDPKKIKPEMLSEAVLYKSTSPDFNFYDFIKSNRSYVK